MDDDIFSKTNDTSTPSDGWSESDAAWPGSGDARPSMSGNVLDQSGNSPGVGSANQVWPNRVDMPGTPWRPAGEASWNSPAPGTENSWQSISNAWNATTADVNAPWKAPASPGTEPGHSRGDAGSPPSPAAGLLSPRTGILELGRTFAEARQPNADQSVPTTAPDPLGPSANTFINSYESSADPDKPFTYPTPDGVQPQYGQPGNKAAFIRSYEQSAAQLGIEKERGDYEGLVTEVKGGGRNAAPAPGEQNAAGQQAKDKPNNAIPMRPDLGDSVKEFESGKRGVDTVSSGSNDPGGVSYGTYQLSSNAKTLDGFLKSPEGNTYASEFDGLQPGSPEFTAKWKEIAARDPDGLHQAEKSFIYRTHYLPSAERAAKLGFDMNNPAIQDAVWSGSIQHGNFYKVLKEAAADQYFRFRYADDQIKSLYSARSDYTDRNNVPESAGRGRYGRELPEVLARNEIYQQARKR